MWLGKHRGALGGVLNHSRAPQAFKRGRIGTYSVPFGCGIFRSRICWLEGNLRASSAAGSRGSERLLQVKVSHALIRATLLKEKASCKRSSFGRENPTFSPIRFLQKAKNPILTPVLSWPGRMLSLCEYFHFNSPSDSWVSGQVI